MQTLLKNLSVLWRIFSSVAQSCPVCGIIKLCLSDNKGNPSSTRIIMLIIVLWFIADWLMEFHSKGSYTLTWEKLTFLTSAFGLKAIQKFPESSGNYSSARVINCELFFYTLLRDSGKQPINNLPFVVCYLTIILISKRQEFKI